MSKAIPRQEYPLNKAARILKTSAAIVLELAGQGDLEIEVEQDRGPVHAPPDNLPLPFPPTAYVMVTWRSLTEYVRLRRASGEGPGTGERRGDGCLVQGQMFPDSDSL